MQADTDLQEDTDRRQDDGEQYAYDVHECPILQ